MSFNLYYNKADIVITDYTDKKVVDYLKPGMTALLEFPHGLGDDVMFMPTYLKLCEMFPNTIIDLNVASGREDVFGCYNHNLPKYDILFLVNFPESHNLPGKLSKPEYCCIHEIGIQFSDDLDFTWKPSVTESYIIGVNFKCNSNPDYNIPYRTAKNIWLCIQDNGLIPIEIYFEHKQYNQINNQYDFITATTRGVKPSVKAFTSIIRSCKGFVGVNSGSLCMAVATLPESNIIHLHTRHPFNLYHKNDKTLTLTADGITQFDMLTFNRWLKQIKEVNYK